jgi:hypothetical protein
LSSTVPPLISVRAAAAHFGAMLRVGLASVAYVEESLTV